jgi:hypothetical protein
MLRNLCRNLPANESQNLADYFMIARKFDRALLAKPR